ncbi:sigma-70 family RNA polymerase sigma factor [Pseudonocardia sp. CA-107938]|uniref:sigma-70 family RNA polymerase sigma factor n=1 Tax=Pseudonocardia sp. CA-107938 TaxID=3240021 RepID=UPI003D93A61F
MTRSASSEVSAVELARAREGDDDAFARIVEPYRRELQVHCYRMLGSVHDAEDALQDALVRAWRSLGGFEERSSVRAWLYKISTNVCLTAIERRGRRALPVDFGSAGAGSPLDPPATEIDWLEPFPDVLVEDGRAAPHARYEQREGVELAFVAALQHLPGNQRAALVLFEVLGFSAREIADVMETSTASVNSALQRARRIIDEKVPERSQQQTLRALGDAKLGELVGKYADALERRDTSAILALLTEDATWSMPPLTSWFRGAEQISGFLARGPHRVTWKHVPTRANGQLAVGCYIRSEETGRYEGKVLDVLTLDGERIAAVTAFIDPSLFAAFELPESLPAE